MRVATGTEQYTMDHAPDGLLHMAVLLSPVAHARISSIDTTAAEQLPGVRLVLTHRDSPVVAFSTARHDSRLDDPDDWFVFDDTVRFVGQRVAAVVADTPALADNARRLIRVDYAELPAVFDPEAARSAGAPLVHDGKGPDARIADVSRNLVAELHGGVGDVQAGLVAARESGGAVVRGRWTTQRVQHAHLETHGCTGWRDDEGRLVIRTSSQVPFLVRDELCHVFGLDRSEVHVFTRRVGGGFGGKQEMLTEDLVALAVLRLGQPIRYEFSRSDEFTTAPCRHPVRVDATVAAGADGVLTALAVDVLMDAGLRQSQPWRHVSRVRRVGLGVPVRQQARRRSVGVHQQHSVRSVPRVRPWAGDLRRRVGAGRAGATARHRSVRPPTPQRRRAG